MLGEFQYAFVSFLLGENFQSFEQWKKLLVLALNSESFLEENESFCLDLIPVIYGQLKQFPADFFFDTISRDNFTKDHLCGFIEICR